MIVWSDLPIVIKEVRSFVTIIQLTLDLWCSKENLLLKKKDYLSLDMVIPPWLLADARILGVHIKSSLNNCLWW